MNVYSPHFASQTNSWGEHNFILFDLLTGKSKTERVRSQTWTDGFVHCYMLPTVHLFTELYQRPTCKQWLTITKYWFFQPQVLFVSMNLTIILTSRWIIRHTAFSYQLLNISTDNISQHKLSSITGALTLTVTHYWCRLYNYQEFQT